MHILLVGNPNCGKTTLFNGLTGENQRIGNWPGVTVEKKQAPSPLRDEKLSLPIYPVFTVFQPAQERPARMNRLRPEQ